MPSAPFAGPAPQRTDREWAHRLDRPFRSCCQFRAEAFTVRQVCGSGTILPTARSRWTISTPWPRAEQPGCAEQPGQPIASQRAASARRGAHLAAITWDVAADGPIPVARSDAQLIAGGLAVLLESRIRRMRSSCPPCCRARLLALPATLLPWLLVGERSPCIIRSMARPLRSNAETLVATPWWFQDRSPCNWRRPDICRPRTISRA